MHGQRNMKCKIMTYAHPHVLYLTLSTDVD